MITISRIVDKDKTLLYKIAERVEDYPRFLPFWEDAVIIEEWDDSFKTEQTIAYGLIRETFQTITTLKENEIHVTSSDTVFNKFALIWIFEPLDKGTQVTIQLECEAKSFVTQMLVAAALPSITSVSLDSFLRYADSTVK